MHKNTGSLSIKNWNEDDRPREKLTVKGKGSLTDAELVAIIIGSGNREESAVTLSKRILASVAHQIDALGKLSIKQLTSFHGIGEAKAIAIVAALELGRRRKNEAIPVIPKISCSKDAYEMLRPMIGDLQHEEFWVIYLNNANKVLCKKQISSGGKTGTIVDSRLVFKNALEFDATTIILAHNHPSGSISPSSNDRILTKKIKKAGEIIEIKLLDHLIVTEKNYFSFADETLL